MSKTKNTKKSPPKAQKLIDKLVKEDVDNLRIRSKISAGLIAEERCAPKCNRCMPGEKG